MRRRRHLLPGQHHQEPRPDHQGRRAHPVAGHAADDHGRRPLDRLSHRPRGRAMRGGEGGDHPRRPPRGHAGKGHGRDHAHLSVVPRHQYPELPAVEPGAAGDRRLAGAPRRREGGAGARHDDPDRQRHREDRDRQDDRDRAGSRVEGGERRLPVVRHRLARCGIRPRDGLARAGRTAPPRGARSSSTASRRKGSPPWRSARCRRRTTSRTSRR